MATGSEREIQLEKLDEFLKLKRIEWRDRIKSLSEDIKDIKKLAEVGTLVSSYRAMLIENIANIAVKSRRLHGTYNVFYKQKYHYYKNYDFKLTDKVIHVMAEADLINDLMEIGHLDIQLDFYKEAVKTLDQMSWAIKNRIAIENLMF